jgi:hypothetical protein
LKSVASFSAAFLPSSAAFSTAFQIPVRNFCINPEIAYFFSNVIEEFTGLFHHPLCFFDIRCEYLSSN